MAVTKQTYSVSPVWTAAGLANQFRSAFIDAGLMTEWYDSFSDAGIENRILEITYDGAATYGKCYYWFMFSTTFVGVQIATGWSTATDVPTGTQYLDFYSAATNTTANHYSIGGTLIAGTEASIVRYTSADDPDYSWFVFRNGAIPYPFMIAPANVPRVAWLDLDRTMFHHFITPGFRVRSLFGDATSAASIRFDSQCRIRRSFVGGYRLRATIVNGFRGEATALNSYQMYSAINNNINTLSSDSTSFDPGSGSSFNAGLSTILVPAALSSVNPAYTSDYVPVLFGPSYSPYVNERLPDDFAIYFPLTTTVFAYGSRVVITAGTEEWEVLQFLNNSPGNPSDLNANPLLLARVV
jgi:hypothetical protein